MSNRLALESSPYLNQHRDNPVDWWPWCEEALALARREQRPILLSIGYSACHWCHVMAHESFEDADTAALMNALFVNIKVDREERPDLDKLYQLAHQALVQRPGGWPLTVFLTPDDHLPFYAGTYFPRARGRGMPAFTEVLHGVRDWYDQRPQEVRTQNASLRRFLDEYLAPSPARGQPSRAPIDAALQQLARLHDPVHGGFGRAPKFPHTADLELLLACATPPAAAVGAASAATADPQVATVAARAAPTDQDERYAGIVTLTLERMAAGGIHDQLGGGFSRYSVDAQWAIPHFEKMLYDNALLLPLYAHEAVRLGRDDFAEAARGIVAWAQREMAGPEGGWYAALDADSEGEEGRYYVWDAAEVRALLAPAQWALVAPHYGFDLAPNFEGHAWNPVRARPLAAVAAAQGMPLDDAQRLLAAARAAMHARRAQRVRPGTDDKRLTAWNAMFAAGLSRASRHLSEPGWSVLAARTLDFLRRAAWRDGVLYASWKDGEARFPAYLDDYAWLLDALAEQLATEFDPALLDFARELAPALLGRFEDPAHGGFWFTATGHEALIGRQKPIHDDSIPSGNGAAVRALLRLGHLLGEPRWIDAAERALRGFMPALAQSPQGSASLLLALHEWLAPPAQVVVRVDAASRAPWQATVDALRRAGHRIYLIDSAIDALPGLLGERRPHPGGIAYVCRGTTCLAPITSPTELATAL